MARKIKLRAWDGEDFKPLEDDGDYYFRDDGDGLTLYNKFGECKNIVLLQFSGLLDKNGVEIYEGDIVKYFFPDPDNDFENPVVPQTYTEYREVVKHSEGQFCVKSIPLCAILDCDAEIIGNVHENPELLNSKP